MQASHVTAELRRYITEQFLDGDDSELDNDTPLLEWGVIDSVKMFSLLRFIQSNFAITVPEAEVNPRNFYSIAVIQRMILRIAAQGTSGADG